MVTKNLWGELPDAADIRSPVTILREQASLLTQMTNGTLQGEVYLENSGGRFSSTLYILAPALDDYRYSVLSVQYPVVS